MEKLTGEENKKESLSGGKGTPIADQMVQTIICFPKMDNDNTLQDQINSNIIQEDKGNKVGNKDEAIEQNSTSAKNQSTISSNLDGVYGNPNNWRGTELASQLKDIEITGGMNTSNVNCNNLCPQMIREIIEPDIEDPYIPPPICNDRYLADDANWPNARSKHLDGYVIEPTGDKESVNEDLYIPPPICNDNYIADDPNWPPARNRYRDGLVIEPTGNEESINNEDLYIPPPICNDSYLADDPNWPPARNRYLDGVVIEPTGDKETNRPLPPIKTRGSRRKESANFQETTLSRPLKREENKARPKREKLTRTKGKPRKINVFIIQNKRRKMYLIPLPIKGDSSKIELVTFLKEKNPKRTISEKANPMDAHKPRG